jgi:hypothetical protein
VQRQILGALEDASYRIPTDFHVWYSLSGLQLIDADSSAARRSTVRRAVGMLLSAALIERAYVSSQALVDEGAGSRRTVVVRTPVSERDGFDLKALVDQVSDERVQLARNGHDLDDLTSARNCPACNKAALHLEMYQRQGRRPGCFLPDDQTLDGLARGGGLGGFYGTAHADVERALARRRALVAVGELDRDAHDPFYT